MQYLMNYCGVLFWQLKSIIIFPSKRTKRKALIPIWEMIYSKSFPSSFAPTYISSEWDWLCLSRWQGSHWFPLGQATNKGYFSCQGYPCTWNLRQLNKISQVWNELSCCFCCSTRAHFCCCYGGRSPIKVRLSRMMRPKRRRNNVNSVFRAVFFKFGTNLC